MLMKHQDCLALGWSQKSYTLVPNVGLLNKNKQNKQFRFIVILSIWSWILRSITLILTRSMHLFFFTGCFMTKLHLIWHWIAYDVEYIAYFRHQTTGTKISALIESISKWLTVDSRLNGQNYYDESTLTPHLHSNYFTAIYFWRPQQVTVSNNH